MSGSTPERWGRNTPGFARPIKMNRMIGRLLLSRLVISLLTLWFVASVVFVITNLLPGDVAQTLLGQSATPEAVAGLRQSLGLDLPPAYRYVAWLGKLVTGDAGR